MNLDEPLNFGFPKHLQELQIQITNNKLQGCLKVEVQVCRSAVNGLFSLQVCAVYKKSLSLN